VASIFVVMAIVSVAVVSVVVASRFDHLGLRFDENSLTLLRRSYAVAELTGPCHGVLGGG